MSVLEIMITNDYKLVLKISEEFVKSIEFYHYENLITDVLGIIIVSDKTIKRLNKNWYWYDKIYNFITNCKLPYFTGIYKNDIVILVHTIGEALSHINNFIKPKRIQHPSYPFMDYLIDCNHF